MTRREALPYRTVLAFAAQRSREAARRCRIVLDLLAVADAIRGGLRSRSADLRVGVLDTEVLICLLALDAASLTPAALAAHTTATRPSVTESLDRLEARALVVRERDRGDRRSVTVRLTPAGAAFAQVCLARFVESADLLAGDVPPSAEALLAHAWASVTRAAGGAAASVAPPPPFRP